MSDLKSALLMSKLGKKKSFSSTSDSAYDEKDFRGIKDGVKDAGPIAAEKPSTGSLELLKSYKAGSMGVPSANPLAKLPLDTIEQTGELSVPKAKKVPYSPIKNYLKTGR